MKKTLKKHEIVVEGRCQILELHWGDTVIELVNIYAPNKDSEQIVFYRKLQRASS